MERILKCANKLNWSKTSKETILSRRFFLPLSCCCFCFICCCCSCSCTCFFVFSHGERHERLALCGVRLCVSLVSWGSCYSEVRNGVHAEVFPVAPAVHQWKLKCSSLVSLHRALQGFWWVSFLFFFLIKRDMFPIVQYTDNVAVRKWFKTNMHFWFCIAFSPGHGFTECTAQNGQLYQGIKV